MGIRTSILRLNHAQAPIQLCDIHLSVDEVESCLINLDHTKASGPDQIPGRLLKLTATEIAPSLTRLFNHSLQLGKMPRRYGNKPISIQFLRRAMNTVC